MDKSKKYTLKTAHPSPVLTPNTLSPSIPHREIKQVNFDAFDVATVKAVLALLDAARDAADAAELAAWAKVRTLAKMGGM